MTQDRATPDNGANKTPYQRMVANSYYAVLGIQPAASAQQIRQAYRDLSKLYHPDTTTLAPTIATPKFQQLNEAYATLSNPERRQVYDQKIGYSRVAVVQPLPSLRQTARPPAASSAYLDATDRPLSPGEIFAIFILGLTVVGCLVLAIAIGITRGPSVLDPVTALISPALIPQQTELQSVVEETATLSDSQFHSQSKSLGQAQPAAPPDRLHPLQQTLDLPPAEPLRTPQNQMLPPRSRPSSEPRGSTESASSMSFPVSLPPLPVRSELNPVSPDGSPSHLSFPKALNSVQVNSVSKKSVPEKSVPVSSTLAMPSLVPADLATPIPAAPVSAAPVSTAPAPDKSEFTPPGLADLEWVDSEPAQSAVTSQMAASTPTTTAVPNRSVLVPGPE